MRRIGLIISSLLAAGTLFGAVRAFANTPEKPATAIDKKLLNDASKKQPREIFTPAKATKQGQVDDRLIRPHRSYDASAGFVG